MVDLSFLRAELINRMRVRNQSPEEAARDLASGYGIPPNNFAEPVASIRREGLRNALLDSPPGILDPKVRDEAGNAGWYVGDAEADKYWPRLKEKLLNGSMRDAVEDIDNASRKVVANLADPNLHNLTKRGLVLGYVQSGKTANFTAVMAKAADAGYSLFIVFSGLHNNLRAQTQVRLDGDLVDDDWHTLTNRESDFAYTTRGAALLKGRVPTLAVVKKNQARLRALRDWLRDIPEDIRRRVPILILDDEADQATPNSANGLDNHSRINELVRQIWAEVVTGTYIGYTATPFANIFMDPADEQELYPADFIIDLPRPDTYFGAERIFGREALDADEEPDPGLDMIRTVPDEDAEVLRVKGNKEDRKAFDPPLPPSLVDAVRWFLIATAIRRARGQVNDHSSMLIHTTHFVDPHFAMSRRVDKLIDAMRANWDAGLRTEFEEAFDREKEAAAEVATLPMPSWEEVEDVFDETLASVRVVVDNGSSEDRLDYDRANDDGEPLPETVIAIGGGTLSRGLTLEGLVVSYFTRTSNTYDTLLQMGRWFGFRTGYEDLPRMWLQGSLEEEFRFLALVEEEIRRDIRDMERMQVTPRQLGVRVRAHPGRLDIVSRNKMQYADQVSVTYSGQRLQTFLLEESDAALIRRNTDAVRSFVRSCLDGTPVTMTGSPSRWLLRDVPAEKVLQLLTDYEFHPAQRSLDSETMTGWILQAIPDRPWNVVIAGRGRPQRRPDGEALDLGVVDLGLDEAVPAVNRAPLSNRQETGTANIKALLSQAEWFADLDATSLTKEEKKNPRSVRRQHADGRGLIIIMPVSKHSIPLSPASIKAESRRPMEAPEHVVGLGIIFPETAVGSRDSGAYYSVHPDWEPEVSEDDDIPDDTAEEDAQP